MPDVPPTTSPLPNRFIRDSRLYGAQTRSHDRLTHIVHVGGAEFFGFYRRCAGCGTVLMVLGLDEGAYVEAIPGDDRDTYVPLGARALPKGGAWLLCTGRPKPD